CYRNLSNFSDHQLPGVAYGAGAGKVGNLGIGNRMGIIELFRERPQAGAQHQHHPGLDVDLLSDEFSRLAGLLIFVWRESSRGRSHQAPLGINMPTMAADIKFAMVPAIIARKPSRASSPR